MNYIDLFSGAGGLSEGFIRNGFNAIAHVEMDINSCNTLKTRIGYYYLKKHQQLNIYKDYLRDKINKDEFYSYIPENKLSTIINENINEESISSIFKNIDQLKNGNKIDLIIGGPPCQAYSLVGRSRDPHRMMYDSRNYLFIFYAEFLKKYKPKYFIFENVTGLLTAQNYLDKMIKLFQSNDVGYNVAIKVLNASDYGVLQKRKRVILFGRRGKRKFDFPEVEKHENSSNIKEGILSDLPKLITGVTDNSNYIGDPSKYLQKFKLRCTNDILTQHITRPNNSRDLEIYKIAIDMWLNDKKRLHYNELPENLRTHKNQVSFLDRYKVVDPDSLSHTLVAHIAKDGHYYIYPDNNQIRSISIREAARIQSFPDNYYFEGSRSSAFKQIGNAVPPLMAEQIAKVVKTIF